MHLILLPFYLFDHPPSYIIHLDLLSFPDKNEKIYSVRETFSNRLKSNSKLHIGNILRYSNLTFSKVHWQAVDSKFKRKQNVTIISIYFSHGYSVFLWLCASVYGSSVYLGFSLWIACLFLACSSRVKLSFILVLNFQKFRNRSMRKSYRQDNEGKSGTPENEPFPVSVI